MKIKYTEFEKLESISIVIIMCKSQKQMQQMQYRPFS